MNISDNIRVFFSEQTHKLLSIPFSYVTFFLTLYCISSLKINPYIGLIFWAFYHFLIFKPRYCVPSGYFCLVKTRYRNQYNIAQGSIYVTPVIKELFKDEHGLVATFPLEHAKSRSYSCSNDMYEILVEISFRIEDVRTFLDHCSQSNKNAADMLRYVECDKDPRYDTLQMTSFYVLEEIQKRIKEATEEIIIYESEDV